MKLCCRWTLTSQIVALGQWPLACEESVMVPWLRRLPRTYCYAGLCLLGGAVATRMDPWRLMTVTVPNLRWLRWNLSGYVTRRRK